MIIGLFPELQSSGGVQRVGRHIAAALAEYAKQSGADYRFLSLNDPPGLHSDAVGACRFDFSGYERAKGRFLIAALGASAPGHTVVISAHPNLAPLALAMRVVAPRLRSVVHTHGIEVWNRLDWLRSWALRAADLVLAPSIDTTKKVIEVQGVSREKVKHLPWGLDPEFRADLSANSKDPAPRLANQKIVLAVGRMAKAERYKGIDIIIAALPQTLEAVPDLQFVVVGDGDDRSRLEHLASYSGLADRVHFLGDLPQNELIATYLRCSVFVLPSRGEGFGLVFLEAMALGRPVVGPSYGAPAEFIQHGQHGLLVDPESPKAVAAALIKLLTSPERASQMGQAAKQWVSSEYSYERFRDKFHTLLNDCLS